MRQGQHKLETSNHFDVSGALHGLLLALHCRKEENSCEVQPNTDTIALSTHPDSYTIYKHLQYRYGLLVASAFSRTAIACGWAQTAVGRGVVSPERNFLLFQIFLPKKQGYLDRGVLDAALPAFPVEQGSRAAAR